MSVIEHAQSKNYSQIAIVTHGKFTKALFDHIMKIEEEVNLKLSAINVIDFETQRAILA